MAISINDTRTVFNDGDSVTGWTASLKTPQLYTSDPNPVELSGCIGLQVSTSTSGMWYTAGTSIDLSGGDLVYVWVLANGIMDTTAAGGIQLLLGDGTNRIGFHLAGSDKAAFRHNNGSVAWQCLVLDTGNLPGTTTAIAGTLGSLNLAAITQIGAVFKTLAKSVGGTENCFIDIIRYGNDGLIITGGDSGTPITFEEIADDDVLDTSGKAYGIFRIIGAGVYSCQGKLSFGEPTGSADTYFQDGNATLVFEDRGLQNDKYKFIVTASTTATTEFYLGSAVTTGSDETKNGVGGAVIEVPSAASAEFLASGDLNGFGLFATTLVGFTEGIEFSSTTSGSEYQIYGSSFRGNGQVIPAHAEIRNSDFRAYSSSSAAMLWSSGVDVKYSSFEQNTDVTLNPAGIEHDTVGEFTYDGLLFSGNDFDILNSTSGHVGVTASLGSNPTSFTNTGGGSTSILNAVTYTVTDLETDSRVVWIRNSDDTELANVAESGGIASYTYNYTGDTSVDIQILSLGFRNKIITAVLGDEDASLPASQNTDRVYFNP